MSNKESIKKLQNPYGFAVRVINDLGQEQSIAPGDRAKVRLNKGEYEQSPLKLVEYDKRTATRKKVAGIDIELRRLDEEQLRKLCWAMLIDDYEDVTKLDKRGLVRRINFELDRWNQPTQKVEVEKESIIENIAQPDEQEIVTDYSTTANPSIPDLTLSDEPVEPEVEQPETIEPILEKKPRVRKPRPRPRRAPKA